MVDLGSDGLLVLLKDRREILRANDDANLAMMFVCKFGEKTASAAKFWRGKKKISRLPLFSFSYLFTKNAQVQASETFK